MAHARGHARRPRQLVEHRAVSAQHELSGAPARDAVGDLRDARGKCRDGHGVARNSTPLCRHRLRRGADGRRPRARPPTAGPARPRARRATLRADAPRRRSARTSALRRTGPTPGSVSSSDAVWPAALRVRCPRRAKRCASSRTLLQQLQPGRVARQPHRLRRAPGGRPPPRAWPARSTATRGRSKSAIASSAARQLALAAVDHDAGSGASRSCGRSRRPRRAGGARSAGVTASAIERKSSWPPLCRMPNAR